MDKLRIILMNGALLSILMVIGVVTVFVNGIRDRKHKDDTTRISV
jgi:hypothetical protein